RAPTSTLFPYTTLFRSPPEVLAYHYAQAGELAVAIGHLIRAAERAQQAGAHREEATLLGQAIDFAEQTGQRQLALELRMRRGNRSEEHTSELQSLAYLV